MQGNVEAITEEAVLGWAHDPQNPETAVAVAIFLDDELVGTVPAAAFREDLRSAKLGDGRKAFYFNPAPFLRETESVIRIAFLSTDETLPNGLGRLCRGTKITPPDWDAPFRNHTQLAPIADRLAVFPRSSWPRISVVMPTFNTPPLFLERAVQSVRSQFYPDWELCIVDDGSTDGMTPGRLCELAGDDKRITILALPTNQGISAASNHGIARVTGTFTALLDHDDELSPNALAEIAVALLCAPDTDVVYTDQDKCDEAGNRFQSFHKPDWSPIYFLGVMYIGHLLVVRTKLLRRAGGCDLRFDRVQDYELMLRLSELTSRIAHLPQILYHWRTHASSIALSSHAKGQIDELQVQAVQAHLDRRHLPIRARSHPSLPHRVQLFPGRADDTFVSIIIPTKDAPEHISRCLASLHQLTTHAQFEVIIADNDTTDPVARRALAEHPVRCVDVTGKFNFSRANNLAAREARGEVLVFLNNDTEIVTPDWLQILLCHLALPDVGAVGPLLLYPDGTVQHAGVALGLRGTCDHVLRHADPASDGYAGSLPCAHEVSALTGACLMIRRDVFLEHGGMEEGYASVYQDADLCLRLRERGLISVYAGNVVLRHHESASRGKHYDFVDRALFLDRWGAAIAAGDPYYNPNFTRNRCDYVPR